MRTKENTEYIPILASKKLSRVLSKKRHETGLSVGFIVRKVLEKEFEAELKKEID